MIFVEKAKPALFSRQREMTKPFSLPSSINVCFQKSWLFRIIVCALEFQTWFGELLSQKIAFKRRATKPSVICFYMHWVMRRLARTNYEIHVVVVRAQNQHEDLCRKWKQSLTSILQMLVPFLFLRCQFVCLPCAIYTLFFYSIIDDVGSRRWQLLWRHAKHAVKSSQSETWPSQYSSPVQCWGNELKDFLLQLPSNYKV